MREQHVLIAELIEDRQTMRYSCPTCHRCLEDGPEGLIMINRGDLSAAHRGGSIAAVEHEIEQNVSPVGTSPERHRLH